MLIVITNAVEAGRVAGRTFQTGQVARLDGGIEAKLIEAGYAVPHGQKVEQLPSEIEKPKRKALKAKG